MNSDQKQPLAEYPPGPPPVGFIEGSAPEPPPGYNDSMNAPNFPPSHGYAQPPPQGAYYPPPQQPYGAPIINQPGKGGYAPIPAQDGWMNMPQMVSNCPPGLEYLSTIDQLLVKQKVELMEAFTGFESKNKFTVLNSLGQRVYWAAEKSDCCSRNCCGASRPFDVKIMDLHRTEVIHLYRPLRCNSCWFPCCNQIMEVSSPPGTIIGTVEQMWSLCRPSFGLMDQHGKTVLSIEGPMCTSSICGDREFRVLNLEGDQVGEITKEWSGLSREMFTDADHFGISFPINLDVKMKAVLLGACFLIDMMFFENKGNPPPRRH